MHPPRALKPEDMAGYAGARASAAAEFVRAQIDAIANEYEIGGGVIDSAAKKLLDSLFVGLAESPTNIIQAQPDQLMAGLQQRAEKRGRRPGHHRHGRHPT